MDTSHLPEGYSTLTAYYLVDHVANYLEFLQAALGAKSSEMLKNEAGEIMHAEVNLGTSKLMLGPLTPGRTKQACMQYMFVSEVDQAYALALAHGAESVREPVNSFYGHRTAAVRDLEGNEWWFARRTEVLTSDEIERRARGSQA